MPKLMADPDVELWQALLEQIQAEGPEALAPLERIWENTMTELVQQRAEQAMNAIRRTETAAQLKSWVANPVSLEDGMEIIHRHFYPHLNFGSLVSVLLRWVSYLPAEKKKEAKTEEKIRLINHLLYDVKQLKPAEASESSLAPCFLSHALEYRRGSPVVQAGIFLLASYAFDLKVNPVRIPRGMLLRWDYEEEQGWNGNRLSYFVNPSEQGTSFSERELELYFRQSNQEGWMLEPVDVHPHVFWMKSWLEEMKAILEQKKPGLFLQDVQRFHLCVQGLEN